MATAEDRATLARVAQLLNERARARRLGDARLPPLILMTDTKRLPDPVAAVRALPPGSAVIVRHPDDTARAQLAESLAPIARSNGVHIFVANDAGLAVRIKADGLHLAEANAANAAEWRAAHPDWLITAAAHSGIGVAIAVAARADAAILSTVFATKSHPGRAPLSITHASMIAKASPIPVYALGGIDARTALQLEDTPFAGIAAIGALAVD